MKRSSTIESRLMAIGTTSADVEEKFLRGSGPGGQKINKTSSTVWLQHRPTGVEVRIQRERSQSANRELAWELLANKLEARKLAATKAATQAKEAERRRTRPKTHGQKVRDDRLEDPSRTAQNSAREGQGRGMMIFLQLPKGIVPNGFRSVSLLFRLAGFCSMSAFSGCTSGPIVHAPASVPIITAPASEADARSAPSSPPVTSVGQPAPAPVPAIPHPAVVDPVGERRIALSSDPEGARILVNNQPMGRTPLRLAIKITPQGFCADYITIRARFVAEDASHVSQTIDIQLTPLEKPPSTLHFTPAGAQRRIQ